MADRLTCRLLPYQVADGVTNMAIDEALLQTAQKGVATIRFYGWSPATLSLGYFQSEQTRLGDPRLAVLPFVRRMSGGDTLVHHHELTYALALPPGPWQPGGSWLVRMHEIIAAALQTMGISAQLHERAAPAPFTGVLCFHHLTPGDLIVGGAKVVGSAQRKRRGALLQHGGVLLARSEFTPTLPGLLELTGRAVSADNLMSSLRTALGGATGAAISERPLDDEEMAAIAELRRNKFELAAWNCKR